jgi:hypothetical protein
VGVTRTAAAVRGLDGFPDRHIEVVIVRGRWRKRAAWIVHESRTLRGVDLADAGGLPVTSVARRPLDRPAVTHPYLVAKALDHACRRDRGLPDTIVQWHLELPRRGRRGARLVGEMLDERLGAGRFTGSAVRGPGAAPGWDRARRRYLKRLGWDTVEITYDDVTKRRRTTGRELYGTRVSTVLSVPPCHTGR